MSDIHRKHTQKNGQNSGGRETLYSRGKLGPGEKPSWGETRLSGTGVSYPGQES